MTSKREAIGGAPGLPRAPQADPDWARTQQMLSFALLPFGVDAKPSFACLGRLLWRTHGDGQGEGSQEL